MMEQIDMTKYLPCTARLVGGTLYILDGEGRVQRRLDPLQTAIEWFQMSNDAFYARYGVNWIPKEPYYSQARRMVHGPQAAARIRCHEFGRHAAAHPLRCRPGGR